MRMGCSGMIGQKAGRRMICAGESWAMACESISMAFDATLAVQLALQAPIIDVIVDVSLSVHLPAGYAILIDHRFAFRQDH